MSRKFLPKIVTANALLEGDAIYFDNDDAWSRNLTEAAVATTAVEADELLARASKFQDLIVGAYLADVVAIDGGGITPAHFREAFRTRGPSNYFHGKQEQV